ncbi:MAG: Hsp20/alpha crystallin family protein [Proteobacteria bacterium]|nr:Hsp20/alpha crystallin family protein [Pseudomonadota bacterium]
MTVLRYEPWALRFVDGVSSMAADSGAWVPATDIAEEPAQFVLHVDLPGVDPAQVEITAEQGVLTIRGNREIKRAESQDGYRRVERLSGDFQRRFTLPESADAQNIRAKASNGVLEVVIPKLAQVLPRRIEIKAA